MSTAHTPGHTHQDDIDALKKKAGKVKDAVTDLASESGHYASHRVSDARSLASDYYGTARERLSGVNEQVADYVQKNPFKAVGIAIGVGFLAGLLLKRR